MRNLLIFILLVVAAAGGWLLGNQTAANQAAQSNDENISTPVKIARPNAIRGIGKLEPGSGIYKIYAPQGERVDSLYGRTVGSRVEAGQALVKLSSLEIRELELGMAEARRTDALNKYKFEKSKGEKKKDAARLAVAEAKSIRDQINSKSKAILLLHDQLKAAKTQLRRFENIKSNPLTSTMIGQTDLDKQQLLIDQLNSKIKEAEEEVRLGNEKADRAENAAELELEAVELAIQKGDNAIPKQSLEGAVNAARKAVELSEIKAPITGEILDVVVRPGDTATNQPVLLLGDTNEMVCVAEINDVNFRFIEVGNKATISGVALPEPIEGSVLSVGIMIGPPSMKDPNPFASVDRKTGRVVIKLDDSSVAKKFVNLQVDVEIVLSPDSGADQ